MATSAVTTNRLSLVEVAKRKDPNGQMAVIAEVLAKEKPILADAQWFEANDTFSNRTTRRSQKPTGSWRKLNEGVANETSKTTQIIDTIGILETRSEVDVEVIDAFPNPKQARHDEAMAFVDGLGDTMDSAMFYGNSSTTPEQFTGLAARMDALATGANVLDAGGSGSDVTSVFVVTWGKQGVHMAYPRNSKVGLQHKDLGIQSVLDTNSLKFEAYCDLFTWKAGMVVRDNKCIGRIANIETTGTSNIFNENDLIRLLNRMRKGASTRIYVNETIMTQMQIRLKDKSNVYFTRDNGLDAGGPLMRFNGYPIRQSDQILITEDAIS